MRVVAFQADTAFDSICYFPSLGGPLVNLEGMDTPGRFTVEVLVALQTCMVAIVPVLHLLFP